MMVFLIGFSTLTQDNDRVSIVTQIVMVECILFSSSTKQIEIWLFCFVSFQAAFMFPKDSLNFPSVRISEHQQIRKYLVMLIL